MIADGLLDLEAGDLVAPALDHVAREPAQDLVAAGVRGRRKLGLGLEVEVLGRVSISMVRVRHIG